MLNIGKCVRLKEKKTQQQQQVAYWVYFCQIIHFFEFCYWKRRCGWWWWCCSVPTRLWWVRLFKFMACFSSQLSNVWRNFSWQMNRAPERERWCLNESFEIALFVRQTRAMIHMYLWGIEERKEKQPNMCLCVSASAEDEAVKFPCRHRHILPRMYTMYNVAQAQWTNCSFKRERFICNSPERKQSKISKFWMYNC